MSEYMLFCLGDGQYESKGDGYQKHYQVFNQQLEKEEWEKINAKIPTIKLPVSRWIDKDDMTKEEKKENKAWSELGGYLKILSYEAAWQVWWNEAKEEEKQAILTCPYFDADIFTKITGLKNYGTKSLKGKTVKVEIDGDSYTAIIQ